LLCLLFAVTSIEEAVGASVGNGVGDGENSSVCLNASGFFVHTADPESDVNCGSIVHNAHELVAENSIALHVPLAVHNVSQASTPPLKLPGRV
jgi:hypothetical protein